MLFLATLLRVLCIYFYLPLYNQDELTILYDAISIVETGKDRWGSDNLFIFRSLGVVDNRPPLYFWIEIILYKFFRIGEYGTRLVATFFGVLGIGYSYLLTKRIINERLARILVLVLTLAPIHILFSSLALESNTIGSTLLIISLYYFVRYFEDSKLENLVISIIFNVSTIYVYQSYKLIAPMVLLVYSLLVLKRRRYTHLVLLVGLAFILASSQLYLFFAYPELYLARANHMVIRSPHVLEFLFGAVINYFKDFLNENWFFNLDQCVHVFNIRFLFIQFPLYLIGFKFLTDSTMFKKREYKYGFLILTFLTALPQLLTNCNMNVFRNNLLIYYIAIIISFGLYYVIEFKRVLIFLIFVNFGIYTYLGYKNESRYCGFQRNLVDFYNKLNHYDDNYSKVIIEKSGNQSYLYLIYYCKISPREFQGAVKVNENNCDFNFDDITRVGKYFYYDKNYIKKENLVSLRNTLVVTENKLNAIPFDSINGKYFYSFK